MPSLQVRELPEPIYRKLKQAAELEHRTLAQQAIVTLAKGLDIISDSKERRIHAVKALQALAKETEGYDLPDPLTMIKEDRSR